MSDRLRAAARLLLLQASWNYERMQGIGVGYASLPLLETVADPERRRAAVARSTELFNAHPYLAGIAAGAAARAERDGVAGRDVQRLKNALAGPLGGVGDQLFWAGLVPGTTAAMMVGASVGAGVWAVAAGTVFFLVVRWWVTVWGLDLGLGAGTGIASALKATRLQLWVKRVVLAAGLIVGVALPNVVHWSDPTRSPLAVSLLVGAGIGAGTLGVLLGRRALSARPVTLLLMLGLLILYSRRP
jgi:PTS system mannose-specific IID component